MADHHGVDPDPDRLPLGATGDFPEGKLTESDEGGLRFAIGHKDGKIVINFGTPVAWLGLSAEVARAMAKALESKAALVELEQLMKKPT